MVGAVTVLRRQKRLDVLLAAAPRILAASGATVEDRRRRPRGRRAARRRRPARDLRAVPRARGATTCASWPSTCCRRAGRRSRSACWRRWRAACRRSPPTSAARARRSRPVRLLSRPRDPRRARRRRDRAPQRPASAARGWPRRHARVHAERFTVERMVGGDRRRLRRGAQYAPRPEMTAGSVASRISMSRASDQPATYW